MDMVCECGETLRFLSRKTDYKNIRCYAICKSCEKRWTIWVNDKGNEVRRKETSERAKKQENSENSEPFCVKLRKIMKDKGVDATTLSAATGYNITNYWTGRIKPSKQALLKIAYALGVTTEEFLEYKAECKEEGACVVPSTLCWTCQNARGDVCSFHRKGHVPVEGLTVIEDMKDGDNTYCFVECPEFIADEPRKESYDYDV